MMYRPARQLPMSKQANFQSKPGAPNRTRMPKLDGQVQAEQVKHTYMQVDAGPVRTPANAARMGPRRAGAAWRPQQLPPGPQPVALPVSACCWGEPAARKA